MDSVTMIRIVAGIVAVIILAVIVTRRKKMAGMKRPAARH
jgi:hypothetical protein